MRVIVLTHGGAEQLVDSLAALGGVVVAGIFVETDVVPRRTFVERIRRSIRYDGCRATLAKIGRLAVGAPPPVDPAVDGRASLDACAARHGIPLCRVGRYDDPASRAQLAAAKPDLGITWGTNILPPSVFDIPRLGTINLHQGHTPHYRGGPSVFWELFNNEPHVGVTVHHVAAAVDAGDMVLQELVPLVYDYGRYGDDVEAFLQTFRQTLSARGAALLVEAVRRIADGTASRQRQDPTAGRRYRLPTHVEKNELRRRLRARFVREARAPLRRARLGPS